VVEARLYLRATARQQRRVHPRAAGELCYEQDRSYLARARASGGAQQRPLSIFLFFLCVFSVQRTLMQIRAVALAAFVLALVCRAMMGVAGLAET
jgi:hypothetical protein